MTERRDLPYKPYLEGVLLVICISAFVLNSTLLAIYRKISSMRTVSDYLLISMAFDDWLRSVFVIPVAIYANHEYWWTTSSWHCQYFAFASTFLGLNSMIHLTTLAVDKWMRIARPLAEIQDKKDAKRILPGLWLFALIWSLFPLFGWSSYSLEPGKHGCSVTWYSPNNYDKAYVFSLFVLFFFIPLLISLFCYINIYLQINALAKKDIKRWGRNVKATNESLNAKIKSTKMAIAMIMGFVFAWSPYAIVSLCTAFGYVVDPLAIILCCIFAKTSTLYNPIVLLVLHNKFRTTLKQMMVELWTKATKQNNKQNTTETNV